MRFCDSSKELDNKYHTLEPTYPSKYLKGLTPVLLPFSCVCVLLLGHFSNAAVLGLKPAFTRLASCCRPGGTHF